MYKLDMQFSHLPKVLLAKTRLIPRHRQIIIKHNTGLPFTQAFLFTRGSYRGMQPLFCPLNSLQYLLLL